MTNKIAKGQLTLTQSSINDGGLAVLSHFEKDAESQEVTQMFQIQKQMNNQLQIIGSVPVKKTL